ncbi:MAG TPA: DCC1-like thiol-disulfide oxidoreductase family protein [Chitinophagaceae bacterium]|mgnify:CR=1 FL=1|nr:DCC1-like thiol-disulfide oxidoreductase family protein [Chitinophagaceae bacterium]
MESPVLLFDGVCPVCNFWVSFIIRHERDHVILFSAQQSAFAQQIFEQYHIQSVELQTIVFIEEGTVFTESAAVFQILRYLNHPWKALHVLRFIPRSMCNVIYRWVARHRYRWFGKMDQCKLYPHELRHRFKE